MVVLAHIKEQSRLSPGSYGRPRVTEELKEVGVDVGHRRVGRMMRENGITVERTGKFKATTDSDHTFNISPSLLDRDFKADQPNQKWAGDISYIWTREGWLYLAVICRAQQGSEVEFTDCGIKRTSVLANTMAAFCRRHQRTALDGMLAPSLNPKAFSVSSVMLCFLEQRAIPARLRRAPNALYWGLRSAP
jgi:hypothetical protein